MRHRRTAQGTVLGSRPLALYRSLIEARQKTAREYLTPAIPCHADVGVVGSDIACLGSQTVSERDSAPCEEFFLGFFFATEQGIAHIDFLN